MVPQPVQQPPKPFPILPVLLVLLVLFLGSTTYLFYQNLQLKQQIAELSKPTPSPTTPAVFVNPKPTLEPIISTNIKTGWKVYEDRQNGFSIEYPPTWSSEPVCLGGIPNDTYLCIKSPELGLSPIPEVINGQVITIGPKGSSYFAGGDLPPSDFCKEDAMSKIKSCTTIKINGIQAIKKIFTNYAFIDVAIIKDNVTAFVIRLQYPREESNQIFDTFDQILSTFTFLEQIKPIDSSAWQTSGDRINSFQIKHPSSVVYGESTDGYARFGFYGPQQKLNSEISDGFVVLIKLDRRQNNKPTLSTYVDNKIEYSKVTSDIIKQKSTISVSGYSGYTYTVRGQGELQYIFLNWPEPAPYSASILEIITVISDPNYSGYQQTVDAMLETIQYSSQ